MVVLPMNKVKRGTKRSETRVPELDCNTKVGDYARDICVTLIRSQNATTRSRCRTCGACNVGPETDIGTLRAKERERMGGAKKLKKWPVTCAHAYSHTNF
jgi:hypothetical protein